jgi:hypothetical protein
MPVEVAACQAAPEVRGALERLLADRWWENESGLPILELVPEDECVFLSEPSMEVASE